MKVGVIGMGYAGLTAGLCLSGASHEVLLMDTDEERVQNARKGIFPVDEPGLDRLHQEGRHRYTSSVREVIEHSKVILVCVGTPQHESGALDTSQVIAAVRGVASAIYKDTRSPSKKTVVLKSTVPVGTTQKLHRIFEDEGLTRSNYSLAFVPEFLSEGRAVADFNYPDRLVLGADEQTEIDVLHEVYASQIKHCGSPLLMDFASAEMSKFATNAFLATKVSFANEVADASALSGADYEKVKAALGADRRVGHEFLNAGLGWGGSCFPKDVQELRTSSISTPTLDGAVHTNLKRPHEVVRFLKQEIGPLTGVKVAILGVAFKPHTNDIRGSQAVVLARLLQRAGATVNTYDPVAKAPVDIPQVSDVYTAADGASALVVATEWPGFKKINLLHLSKHMKPLKVLFDARGLFYPAEVEDKGFIYGRFGL